MVETDFYTALSSASAVTAIVGTRIYPLVLPTDPTPPAIDYKIVASSNTPSMSTMGVQRYRFEVNCWSGGYLTAVTLRNAVIKALSGYSSGNFSIQYLMSHDFFEDNLLQYRACAEFYVMAALE